MMLLIASVIILAARQPTEAKEATVVLAKEARATFQTGIVILPRAAMTMSAKSSSIMARRLATTKSTLPGSSSNSTIRLIYE
jgi:hypothetical protein